MTAVHLKNSLIAFFLLFAITGYAQTLSVVSSSRKESIPKAQILIQLNGNKFHFVADDNGKWKVADKFLNHQLTLTVSVMGFQSKKLTNIILTKDRTITLKSNTQFFDEVAITAQYKKRLVKDAVHNIKIIDHEQIEAMSAQNLKQALENELNVHLTTDNILGSGMQIQGVGGQNVKILVDGVPLTGRLNGNIDLSQIPMDNVKRIEVVEGPLSVSYGTDALAGTINIITKKTQVHKFVGSTNNYFESSGKMNNDLNLGFHFGKHQIQLTGGRHFFDGWDPSQPTFYFKNPIADSTRVQLWNPKTQLFGSASYRFKGKHSLFDYSGRFLDERVIDRGAPRPPYQQKAFDNYFKTIRLGQRANFQYFFKKSYRLSVTAGYSGYFRQKNTKLRDLTTITDVLSSNPSDQDTSQYHSLIARGRIIQASKNKKINYEIGFDLSYEIGKGKKIENRRQNVGDYALYATMEYSPIKALTFRPGLRYGYNTNYNAPLTPSLNVKYAILDNAKQNLTLRGSYARGFRAPSIKELYYTFIDANHDIVGNQNLEAETSNNFNLSLHYNTRLKKVSWMNKLTLFYNDIRNQIALAQSTVTEYSYFNLNQYVTSGFQIESTVNYKKLNVGIGFGYIGRYNKINSDEDFDIDHFLFSPDVNLHVDYQWEKPGLQFALFYKYSGVLPQVVSDENGKYSLETLGNYHLGNVKISKYLWGKRLKISAGVRNIFDVRTVQGSEGSVISAHSSGKGVVTVGTGRTYTIGVKLIIKSRDNKSR